MYWIIKVYFIIRYFYLGLISKHLCKVSGCCWHFSYWWLQFIMYCVRKCHRNQVWNYSERTTKAWRRPVWLLDLSGTTVEIILRRCLRWVRVLFKIIIVFEIFVICCHYPEIAHITLITIKLLSTSMFNKQYYYIYIYLV